MRQQILHSFIVISVLAEAAANSIRQVWPEWQPHLGNGFQGRLVLVIAESELVFEGAPTGIRQHFVVAAGNDGQARESLERTREAAKRGLFAQSNQHQFTDEAFDELVDKAFLNAMPASYLMGRDVSLIFDVPWASQMPEDAQKRLSNYQAHHLAPKIADATDGKPSEWSIPLSLDDVESFYILLDVYQNVRPQVFVRNSRKGDTVGMKYLVDSFKTFNGPQAFAA